MQVELQVFYGSRPLGLLWMKTSESFWEEDLGVFFGKKSWSSMERSSCSFITVLGLLKKGLSGLLLNKT